MTRETLARILVAVIAGSPLAAVVALRWAAPTDSDMPTVELTARMPDAGGWSPEVVTVPAGSFTIFFPEDGHIPGCAVDDKPAAVRKVVVKVAV